MKRIAVITASILLSLFSFAQTVQVTCSLNDTIGPKYKKDADRMAIRRAIKYNTTYKDSIKPKATDRDIYLRALIAVYNATALPQRDTAIKICNIHTWDVPDMNRFSVGADSTLPWMVNLRNNVYPTGCAILDNLKQKYNMQVTQYGASPFTYWHIVDFKTDTNLNTGRSGMDLVLAYPPNKVVAAGPLCCVWDGPDIMDSINPNYVRLDFIYRWWDCIDGCDKIRWWKFYVYNDCSVSFEGSGGNYALPPGLSLEETQIFNDVKFYPNPTTDNITIDLQSSASLIDKLILKDILGHVIKEFRRPPAQLKLELNYISPGVYFMTIQGEKGRRTFKVVKE